MSAWKNSSLAVSDGPMKKSILKPKKKDSNPSMFGSKSKMFTKKSKGSGLPSMKASGSISPSSDEIDNMIGEVAPKKNKKKTMFSRKQFG